jgi:CDGSH-type Zn-finger protein
MGRPVIDCAPNGPYVVRDLTKLSNSKGVSLEIKPVIVLCRCGGSANKPYCDGTHKSNGFSDAKLEDRSGQTRRSYAGKKVTIFDDRSICAHAGHCTDTLAAVFNAEASSWINPDNATVEEIVGVIRRCPSGALSYAIDGIEGPKGAGTTEIEITKDGPYAVSGPCELANAGLAPGAPADRMTLCRCGASKNKPFCDGSHWDRGFKDERN